MKREKNCENNLNETPNIETNDGVPSESNCEKCMHHSFTRQKEITDVVYRLRRKAKSQ